MSEYPLPTFKVRYVGLIFFSFISLMSVIGVPIYIYHFGLTQGEIALFLFFFFATGMAITAGYHRLFAHVTYKTNPAIRFLLLFFGAATFEQSAIKWSSQHRQHHRFTDTEHDPHSTTKGFFYCHVGWIVFYKHKVNMANVKDLWRDKLTRHQHEYYGLWSVAGGIMLPMALGFWIGRPLGAFLLAVCLRMVLVLNAAFLINSYAHMVGKRNFDPNATARDHWLGAVITNGEGYHSFHHRFPSDYRNGYRWYHWDPTKWFIFTLSRLGLANQLKRTPLAKIDDVRLAVSNSLS